MWPLGRNCPTHGANIEAEPTVAAAHRNVELASNNHKALPVLTDLMGADTIGRYFNVEIMANPLGLHS